MKSLSTCYIAIFCLTLLFSCENRQKENKTEIKAETPKALQEDKLEIKSYSRSGDMIEELYQELVDKNPELKKLEEDIEAIRLKPNEPIEKFNAYDAKSNSYYSSANYKATAMSDSVLKNKIIAFISKSENNYKEKTTEINSLLKEVSENGSAINNHHTVLKIVLTLPLIEQYQKDNLPGTKEFKNIIKEQDKLIIKTDSLTPKY